MKRFLIIGGLILCSLRVATATPRGLEIYFIDVEGGASTLIIAPSGESLLVDSGFPTDRDAKRIVHVARLAGLRQIDHYVATHFHRDHIGGIPLVASMLPVKNFYDHGLPTSSMPDVLPGILEMYRQTARNNSVTLKPGDELPLRASRGLPLHIRVLASGGSVVGEEPGSAQIKPCGSDFTPIPEDKTDNANSVAFLLTFGDFQFFDGGDLTWNVENKLVCPGNVIGAVDVYQVDHHGAANSNNPILVRALNPRVAVIDNGPRKGGEAQTFATLKSISDIAGIYQLHRNLQTTDKDNTTADFIANDAEACNGEFIKISVAPNGKTYTVALPGKKISRRYEVR